MDNNPEHSASDTSKKKIEEQRNIFRKSIDISELKKDDQLNFRILFVILTDVKDYFWRKVLLGGKALGININKTRLKNSLNQNRQFIRSILLLTLVIGACGGLFAFSIFIFPSMSIQNESPSITIATNTYQPTNITTATPAVTPTIVIPTKTIKIPQTVTPTSIIMGCVNTVALRIRKFPLIDAITIGWFSEKECGEFDYRTQDGQWLHLKVSANRKILDGWVSSKYINLDTKLDQLPTLIPERIESNP